MCVEWFRSDRLHQRVLSHLWAKKNLVVAIAVPICQLGVALAPVWAMSIQPESQLEQPVPTGTACGITPDASALASDHLTQLVDWVTQPETGLTSLIEAVGPTLSAHFSARPFPEVHEQARLAKVPVMMYHDILPEKEVFFDVTPEEFEADLQLIRDNGLTPISLDQLVSHLATGIPLPEKPILLSFDDGYEGHYQYVYPLLKKYNYPAVFGIYTAKVGKDYGRSSLNWEQLREMAADPLVTIASHSVNHPRDLTELTDDELRQELTESKKILEAELGIPIRHFVYPEGNYDQRVADAVEQAGYLSALTMNDAENKFAGESDTLLSIERIGQSQLETILAEAYGGPPLRPWGSRYNFKAPVALNRFTTEEATLLLISGGRPITIHADSRYQVQEIIANTNSIAAVDGGFFSLKYLDSNVMIGPVLSQSTGKFIPGNRGENPKLKGRPLVMISPEAVQFIPFDPVKHNTLEGIEAELPGVTDAFVAAAWLVKDGKPQTAETFGSLFDYDAVRHRAFWGINSAGQPVIGVSSDRIDSMSLGELLHEAGLQDAVMLDSGASTSLVYQGESLVTYEPRPVPHVVALVPPETAFTSCALVSHRSREADS
jgi:poly-beta-1,6-N-acetyl-D-glucosamine N-deacetylase